MSLCLSDNQVLFLLFVCMFLCGCGICAQVSITLPHSLETGSFTEFRASKPQRRITFLSTTVLCVGDYRPDSHACTFLSPELPHCPYLFIFIVCLFVLDKVSLRSPSWLGTVYGG